MNKLIENQIWELLVNNGLFTEQELQLITDINGYSVETFEDCCMSRYGEHIEDICEREGVYILWANLLKLLMKEH